MLLNYGGRLRLSFQGVRLHLGNKNEKKFFSFCISLDLDKYLTLENENFFSFYLLNRYFALPLQKIYHYGEETLNYFFI